MDALAGFTFPSPPCSPSNQIRSASTSSLSSSPRTTKPHHRRQPAITTIAAEVAATLNYIPPVPSLPAVYRKGSISSISSSPARSKRDAMIFKVNSPPTSPSPSLSSSTRGSVGGAHARQYSTDSSSTNSSSSSRSTNYTAATSVSTSSPSRSPNGYRSSRTYSAYSCTSHGSFSHHHMADVLEEDFDCTSYVDRGRDVTGDADDSADEDEEEFWGCRGLKSGYDIGGSRSHSASVDGGLRRWGVV